jgi:uncharacterized membrane protein
MRHDAVAAIVICGLCVIATMRYGQLQRRHPTTFGRAAKEQLRWQWLSAIITQPQHYVLAIQTLRNSVMAASLIASAFAVLLVGILTVRSELERLASTLHSTLGMDPPGVPPAPKIALVFGLGLLAIMYFLIAVRHYHQLGYVFSPMDNRRFETTRFAQQLLLAATRSYGSGMRVALTIFPILGWLLSPWIAVCVVLVVLVSQLRQVPPDLAQTSPHSVTDSCERTATPAEAAGTK